MSNLGDLNAKQVIITANIASMSDNVTLSLEPREKIPPPQPSPPQLIPKTRYERLAPLYVGVSALCNGQVSNNSDHKGCINHLIGHSIKAGSVQDIKLYLGTEQGVNAGSITTKPNFKGGKTIEYGYTIRSVDKPDGAVELFVVDSGCKDDLGEVSNNRHHKRCGNVSIGYAVP